MSSSRPIAPVAASTPARSTPLRPSQPPTLSLVPAPAPGAEARQDIVDALPRVETKPFLGFVRRVIRSAGRRVADGDIEALADLVAVRDDLEAAISEAVKGLRADYQYSWADIGRVTNTTRQAAQQRYGQPC